MRMVCTTVFAVFGGVSHGHSDREWLTPQACTADGADESDAESSSGVGFWQKRREESDTAQTSSTGSSRANISAGLAA